MKKNYFLSSVVLAILLLVTAVYGLFFPGAYSKETANWATQTKAQDWLDLIVIAPLLLASAIIAYRKSIASLLLWLGTLFFIIYSFLIYTFMLHFNVMFLVYVAILGISVYTVIFGLRSLDFDSIKTAFKEDWSRKVVSIFLMSLGILFYLVWFKDIFNSLVSGSIPQSIIEAGLVTNGVYVIDLAICLPALILSGYYLKKQKQEGYVLGGASLVFSVIMMINIAFITYFIGYKGMSTDYSIAYVFGFLSVITALIGIKYLVSFKKT